MSRGLLRETGNNILNDLICSKLLKKRKKHESIFAKFSSAKASDFARLHRTGRRTRRRTGKLILLFTIVCAGQLYGMGPERGRYVGLGDLPRETQVIIVTYLQTNGSLDGTIAAIKKPAKALV